MGFEIYYSIYYLRRRHWCLEWLFNLIHTPLRKSYACRIYFMSILHGFILLVNIWDVMSFYIDYVYGGMIVPHYAIFCIIWPSGLIIYIITFIHVVYILWGSITRRHCLIKFSTLLYTYQVQWFLHVNLLVRLMDFAETPWRFSTWQIYRVNQIYIGILKLSTLFLVVQKSLLSSWSSLLFWCIISLYIYASLIKNGFNSMLIRIIFPTYFKGAFIRSTKIFSINNFPKLYFFWFDLV